MGRIQVVVIGVIANAKGELLLTRRAKVHKEDSEYKHYWNFPGGGLQYGEKPEEAVVRELREELGITVAVTRLIPYIPSPVRHNWQGVLIPFLCAAPQPMPPIILNSEADQYGWFTQSTLQSINTLPFATDIAQHALHESI